MPILRQQPEMRLGETDDFGSMSADASQDFTGSRWPGVAHSTFHVITLRDIAWRFLAYALERGVNSFGAHPHYNWVQASRLAAEGVL